MSQSPHLSTKILRVYIKSFTAFSHIYHPGGLNNTLLSRGCILKMAPTVGLVGRMHIPGTKEGVEEPLVAWILLIG